MAAKDIGVKKYVIKLSEAERSRLQGVINKGKSPAKRLLKARILLKADAGAHGEGWSDGRIIDALDTNKSMVTRVRQQFVEEGLEVVLSSKQRAAPAITPIFDGEKEARLMALACSTPPEGHARWTLRLLEDKVVELGIVERASDNTIGRVLKKTFEFTALQTGVERCLNAAARNKLLDRRQEKVKAHREPVPGRCHDLSHPPHTDIGAA